MTLVVHPTVGVLPARALRERRRLFDTLAGVFSVRFEERDNVAASDLDAVVAIGCPAEADAGLPVLEYIRGEGGDQGEQETTIELAASERIDVRLRGRHLPETGLQQIPGRLAEGECLARDAAGVAWALRPETSTQVALVAPNELAEHETLRERLSAGRFLALLPLVELLRRITGYESWTRPSPRAAFLFDDPNLHWRSYGYIRFAELARHAREHDYHAAIGLVPLDSWFASKRAARMFREEPRYLSLAIHGNDHTYAELAVSRPPDAASALFEQALARIERFERRTRLHVSRVMIPPHGLSSDDMLNAMAGSGIEALCRAPGWWRDWPGERASTAHWAMADVSPSGVPILGRRPLRDPQALDDATLDLYLDQPAILYGHHYDVAEGYDGLGVAAEWLNRFEGVTWGSCETAARTNILTRLEGDLLRVHMCARRAIVSKPQGVRTIDVELPAYERDWADRLVCGDVTHSLERDGCLVRTSFELPHDDGPIEICVQRRADPPTGRSSTSARAAVRRGTGEVRDRVHPLVRKIGLEPTLRRLERAHLARNRARTRS